MRFIPSKESLPCRLKPVQILPPHLRRPAQLPRASPFFRWESPAGGLLIAEFAGKLILCDWEQGSHHQQILNRIKKHITAPWVEEHTPLLERTVAELAEYFAGTRHSFDLPLTLLGTPLQQKVWEVLQTIDFGCTRSYGEIAFAIDNPKAVRAVAGAVGQNPLSIIIPCHRVIGTNGSLTGYGGGLDAKRTLLSLEGVAL